jgi:isoleucyl-tRNA synthetase
MNGEFTSEVKDFQKDGKGLKVKVKGDTQSTDVEIIKYLAHNGKLFHKQKIIHSYPHCWRCDTPLLNYATTGWFVAVSTMREKLVNINKNILWVPENVRDGRMGQWLENARDWSISRSRYWGAPLPVWKSESEVFVPSSLQDLQKRTKAKNKYTFIRHGEAYSNLDGIINVKIENDKGLTENGVHQIEEIANKLGSENKNFDLIITSPYNRTKQTAEILSKNLNNIEIIIEDKIKEFQLDASWEGEKWSDLYKESEHKFHTKIRGEEESRYELSLRMAQTLYELEEKYEGKNILLVSHSSPIQAINIYNSGKIYEKGGKGPEWKHFENGEILELDFRPLPHDASGAVNFHVPHIDNLKVYDKNGNLMKREGGVFDCWYESGSMPFGQMHYPFENESLFKANFPADFIAEAQDQTRGWFYSMLVLGVALFDKSPFNSVICTGHIMAADGKKQSKRLKNYTDPSILIEKYSSDAVRYYILSSPVVKGENMNFKDEGVGEVLRKHIMRTLNVLSFYNLYKTDSAFGSDSSTNILDKYILARLRETRLKVAYGFDNIELDIAFRPIEKFIDDLSVWYLRRSRERLKDGDENAVKTLRHVLYEFAKVIAPIMPFTAEMLWQDVKGEFDDESVHLAKWTEDIEKTLTVDEAHIIEKMELAREVVTLILDERTKTNNKVRQPLLGATVKSVKYDVIKNDKELQEEIKDETNIKNISFAESDGSGKVLELDLNITEELKLEGLYREVARVVQDKRKEMNFVVLDRVKVTFSDKLSDDEKNAIEKFKVDLKKDCGVVEFSFGENFEIIKI